MRMGDRQSTLDPVASTKHQSGMSLTLTIRLRSMTGLRRTPHRNLSGCCPTRFPVRNPPCDPPITATRSLSTNPASNNTAHEIYVHGLA